MTRTDYTNIGKLTDPQLALLTTIELTALQATMAERDAAFAQPAALQQQHAAELAAKDAAHADALDKLAGEHTTALAAAQAEIAAKDSALKEAAGYVEACGGSDYAQKMAAQAKRDALMKAKEEAEAKAKEAAAELAKLEA